MEISLNNRIRLGEGGYGKVFPGTFRGNKVAVKRVDLIDAKDNEEEVLKQLDHPNIVKLFHVESDENFKYYVLELCEASLDQLFLDSNHPRKYKGPKLPHHSTVFLQLATGLEYIHSKKLIHRDIKPENVLIHVDSTGQEVKVTMKWADFGLSRSVNERGTYTMGSGIKGTNNWYAPELLELINQFQRSTQPRGTVKSDVFALGLVFAFLILNEQHLYGSNQIDIANNILTNKQVNISKIDKTHYALKLIKKMLEHEYVKRISSSDAIIQIKSAKEKLAEKEEEFRRLFLNKELNLKEIQKLIQLGIDVNGKDNDGWNALHLLCFINSSEKLIDVIKLLIQLGIDVNGKGKFGSNALHYLCRYNSSERLIDAIKLLIQLGFDVNGKDNDGWNALHLLCFNNSSEKLIDAIKLLIQLGFDVNGKDNNGWNALHYLCCFNSSDKLIDAIKLLIEKGIDVESNGNNARILLRQNVNTQLSKATIDGILQLLDRAVRDRSLQTIRFA